MARAARTIIHVNRHRIAGDARRGTRRPALTVKRGGGSGGAANCWEVAILDAGGAEVARVVYRPDAPLGCGARAWVETRCQMRLVRRKPSVTNDRSRTRRKAT